MKLCHIVPSLEERHGGPSKSVRALCSALARVGHEVQLFTTHPGAPVTGNIDREGGLEIATFPRDWPERICRSRALDRAIRQSTPDIVHHHSLWLRTLRYAHRSAQRRDARFVISPRGMMSHWAWHHHRWQKRLAAVLLHPRAFDAVTGWHATSTEEANDIRALGFRQPICVAPNGVDTPTPAEIEAAKAHWREACPEVLHRRVALFYSRLHPKKRLLELIDLWVAHAPTDWLLLVVGIPQEYTPEMIESYVIRMSGVGRVRVFGGLGRPAPYAVASLFLLPSHNENFGLVIAEALAHGIPALVTDTTPWTALNETGCGWCVPWPAYADTLRAATAEDPTSHVDRGTRARQWVQHEYSWDRSARLLTSFYASLAAPAGAADTSHPT